METQIVLFLVAIVATAINSIAGGGGLLTFPVLMTVLPPVTADATSAVALLPAYVTSTWAGRKHLAPVGHWFWLLLGPSLLGSLLGALLLNWSGNRSFMALIPWLILIATLLTMRPLLTRWMKPQPPSDATVHETPAPSLALQVASGMLLFLVAIYGGFFFAWIVALVIGAFGLLWVTDVHSALPLENAPAGPPPRVRPAVRLV